MQSRLIITVSRSLTWEFLVRIWPGLSILFACFLGVPALVTVVMRAKGLDFPPEGMMSVPMHLAGLATCIFAYAACILGAQAEKGLELPPRLLWLPVSNRFLIGLRSIQAAAMAFGLYAITMILLDRFFGITSPVWGPAVFAAVVTLFIQATILCLADFRFWKLGIWAVLLAGVIWWLDSRYDNQGYNGPGTLWNKLKAEELLTMITFGLAMFAVSLHSVGRLRNGDSAGWEYLRKWGERIQNAFGWLVLAMTSLIPRSFRMPAEFRSPRDTHIWLEWHTKGFALPLIVFILVSGFSIVASVLIALGQLTAVQSLHVLLNISLFSAIFVPLCFGYLLGSLNYTIGHNHDLSMRDFSGTLPLDDRAMAHVLLRNLATSLWVSALVVAVCWGFWSACAQFSDDPMAVNQLFRQLRFDMPYLARLLGGFFLPGLVVGVLIIAWSLMGLTMSQSMTGRTWILGVPYISLAVFFLIALPVSAMIPRETTDLIGWILANIFGLALLAGVVGCFGFGLSRHLISRTTAIVCLLVTMAICGLTTAYILQAEEKAVNALLFFYGLCALPAAPFATAPVALHFNRHR